MDAMRNLPGVSVDPEGKVLLRGSDKVTVLIDGKQSSLTGFGNQKGLENIPASNIERIEIIKLVICLEQVEQFCTFVYGKRRTLPKGFSRVSYTI